MRILGDRWRFVGSVWSCLWSSLGLALLEMLPIGPAVGQSPQIPPPQDLLPPAAQPIPAPTPQVIPPGTIPQPTPMPPPSNPALPEQITVNQFTFIGGTVFSEAELTQATQSFTQRPITFAELLQAAAAVTQFYVEQGYTTSGAFIPPQVLEDGRVTIQILEGGLEALEVEGLQRLQTDYVRSRLERVTRAPLNTRRLLEALQLLQLNPLIRSISAELTAGTRPGNNILKVQVSEAPTFNLQARLDNGRSPSVGVLRRQGSLAENNLLGWGDQLTLTYTNTDGSDSIEVGYTLPINSANGTLSLSFNSSASQIIESPFEPLDLRASARTVNLTLRQPLYQTPSQELVVGLTVSRQESEITLLGVPFPLSPGSDNDGRTKISALRFFQEWIDRGPESVFAARSQFSLGFGALNSTVNATAPDGRFVSWRGQAQYVQLLSPQTLLVLRGDIQLADRALVPLEQFGLGGQDTVRGYRQDLLLSDSGLFASAELRLPILREPDVPGLVQLVPFFDFGMAWNQSSPMATPSTLAAFGVGLRWQVGDRLTARFDWGIPLSSVPANRRTSQENGLYFSIFYNFF